MEDILEESAKVVEEICEKFNYDREDEKGNDSLRTVLLKTLPAMLADSKKEDRELFYQMLRHTPIVIVENLTREGYDALVEKYIGDVNPHIEDQALEVGEYAKQVADGAYVSEPIIDENMQIKGKKSFIYIQKVKNDKVKEFLGTDIHVPHLQHELGHAWHAEKDQFVMSEKGILTERVGAAEFQYSFLPSGDGKYIRRNDKVTGLMTEEGMNTLAEEKAMANYMGISQEEMKKAYKEVLVESDYQGTISDCVEYLMDSTSKRDLENWRLYGNQESKDKIENWMRKTEFWKNRELDILSDNTSERSYAKKRNIVSRFDEPETKDFFQKYETMYFPDISQMTPLEKLENALQQFYNLKNIKYKIELEDFSALHDRICWESYSLINQTADVKAKEEIMEKLQNVKQFEVNGVTVETRKGLENLQVQKEGECKE